MKLRTMRNNATGEITVEGDTFKVTVSEDGRISVSFGDRSVLVTENGTRTTKNKVGVEGRS
jgi:hypothetical protein